MERELSIYVELKGQTVLVGRLWVKERLGKESATFEYDARWLKHPQKIYAESQPAAHIGETPLSERPVQAFH